MSITQLSTEILQKIYENTTIEDLLHLAQTSKRNYRVYLGRRTHLLEQALHNSFSPLPDLYKLVIAAEPDRSRKPLGTETRLDLILTRILSTRTLPKLSLPQIIAMVQHGKTAARWTELYPQIRWRHNSNNRRLLRPHEAERLRGAIYRYWTYTTLFHSDTFVAFEPSLPSLRTDPRLRLLRTLSTLEIVQLFEYTNKMRQLVQTDLYPSDATVRHAYAEPVPARTLANLGWGSGSRHQLLIHDVMKYSPSDFLHLFESTSMKKERFEFLRAKGPGFWDSPSWLREALGFVLVERKAALDTVYITQIEDEEIEYGIVDSLDDAGSAYYERHRWAKDASVDGSWVDALEED